MSELTIFLLIFTAIFLTKNPGDKRIQKINSSNNISDLKLFKKNNDSLTVDWLEELAAKLQSGAASRIALANSLTNTNFFNTKNACQNGSSISQALRKDLPNDEIARALSSCWDIAEEAGIGLAEAVSQLAKGVQTKNQLKEELTSALTGSRLSAWVLAGLPLFGLFLASLIGENPIKWLLTSKFGLTVLLLGITVELLGIFWVNRITNKVKRQL
jgi:tight adherence protein B